MKGQIINADFAVAAGLFAVGLASAMTVTFTLWQAPQENLEEQLRADTLQIAESFEDSSSWQIKRKNFKSVENLNQGVLDVEKVNGGKILAESGRNIMASDLFDNFIAVDATGNYTLYSGKDLKSIEKNRGFSFGPSSFSNKIINLEYSDEGIGSYSLNGEGLVRNLKLEDSQSVQNTQSGNISALIDYGSQKVFALGGSGLIVNETIENSLGWDQGDYRGTSADRNDNSGILGLGYLDSVRAGQTNNADVNNNSLIGFWRLDEEGSTAKDFSGSDYDGDFQNSLTKGVSGITGTGAVKLSGGSVEANYSLGLSGNKSHTIAIWYKGTSTGGGSLASINYDGNPHLGVDIWINSNDGEIAHHIINSWSGNAIKVSTDSAESGFIPVNNDNWHFIVFTYNGSKNAEGVEAYVDGVKQPTYVESDTLTANKITDPINPVRIGGRSDGSGSISSSTEGIYDNFMVYNRSLSEKEIKKLYFDGNGEYSGSYTSKKIENNEKTNWNLIELQSSVPDETELNLTFEALNKGRILDSQTINILDDKENYSLNVKSSRNSRITLNGTTEDISKTWKVENLKLYTGSKANRDVYIYSRGNSSTFTVDASLDEVKTLQNTTLKDINESRTLEGDSPLIFKGESSLAVTGPDITWKLESEESRGSNVSINGSYYISGQNSFKEAEKRAEASSKFLGRFSRNVTGIRKSKVEDIFAAEESLFESYLRIPEGTNYNISFLENHRGDNLPITESVVSRSVPVTLLRDNGSISIENLEVRLWG